MLSIALVDKMAKNPATVWAFENDLMAKFKNPLATSDLAELRTMKKKLFPSEPDTIYAWDTGYLYQTDA